MVSIREEAVIRIRGQNFGDWESVWVQHRWTEGYPLFRFTAVEREPYPNLWTKQQFNPGELVEIYLGGHLAITGMILTRQVAYDANNHAIELHGVGRTWKAVRASHIDKTGSFDKMNLQQIANKVLAPFGIRAVPVGTVNPRPFDRAQIQPGEPIWTFLENLARPRGVILGSDEKGNLLLIDNHANPTIGALVEGENILKCQSVFSIKETRSDHWVAAQKPATDGDAGTGASEMRARAPGILQVYSPQLTPAEQPVKTMDELKERAAAEALWSNGTQIDVTITVQGWFDPYGRLWKVGDNVHVRSPMAIIDNKMVIEYATFTQDRNAGSLTVLQLKAPWALKDQSPYHVGDPNPPPAEPKVDDKPPEDPKPVEPDPPPAPTLEGPPPLGGVDNN